MNIEMTNYLSTHNVLTLKITHEMFYEHISTNVARIETRSVYPSTCGRYMEIKEDGGYELKQYDALLLVLNEGENSPWAIVEVVGAEYQGNGEEGKELEYDEDGKIQGIMIYHIRKVLYVSNESVIAVDEPSKDCKPKRQRSLTVKVQKDEITSILDGNETLWDVQVTTNNAKKTLCNKEDFYYEDPTGTPDISPAHYDTITFTHGCSKNNPTVKMEVVKTELIVFVEPDGTYAVYDTLFEDNIVCKIRYHFGRVVSTQNI